MREFCYELEQGRYRHQLLNYKKTVEALAKWYIDSHARYEKMLQTELGINLMSEQLQEEVELGSFSDDLSYTFGAKLAYFSVSDTLVKLILSCFSYGCSQQFLNTYGISASDTLVPWLKDKSNELCLTEILAKVLRDESIDYSFDLAALLQDRHQRNSITHASARERCLSAIRVYNSIRAMLIFLNDAYANDLPVFSFSANHELESSTFLNFDALLAEPCNLNFEDSATILVAGSVHDIRTDYRQAVANLAWDLVIDYDGYSDCGGLLSAIKHNQLQKEILTYPVASGNQILSRGTTFWYRCGEYQMPSYIPNNNSIQISSYNYFHKGATRISGKNNSMTLNDMRINLRVILEKMLGKANRLDRKLNIVAAINDDQVFLQILEACESIGINEYFLTAIGVTSLDINIICRDRFAGDKEDMEQHFLYCPCPVDSFYKAVSDHKASIRSRIKVDTDFSVPGATGKVILSENDRANIAPYFDILYDGCEQTDKQSADKQEREFYRGNQASWHVIANHYAVPLKKDLDYNRILQKIRSTLGVTQQKPQQRLLFIRHKAGLGGSTLVRQIGWDLHRDYAILSARYYESNQVKPLIENLYDNILQKAPLVIIADDTLPSLRGLCDDVCRTDRRCILIVACREGNSILREYPEAQSEFFAVLQDRVIPELQTHFRSQSPLPQIELQKKDDEFERLVGTELRTPFIIGLYYMENEFNIEGYVKKAFVGCTERRYADIIACLALCDKYNSKTVPISFVKSALGLRQRENFLTLVPAAATLISQSSIDSDIPTYHFTHSLLGLRYLDLYCKNYYFDDERSMIYDSAVKMIDFTAEMIQKKSLQAYHLDILIGILIQNQKESGPDNLSLSALLQDIGMKERQRQLLQHLADAFKDRADQIQRETPRQEYHRLERVDRLVLRLTAHAYAHLGRMYSRLEKNPTAAEEHFDLAIRYMPDDDPNIYHMAGTSILDKLKQQWNNDVNLSKEDLERKYPVYELDIHTACERFDCACNYGSPDYGYPSKLDLLFSYLSFIYRAKQISDVEGLNRLSTPQQSFRLLFIETLEEAKSLEELDETARQRIQIYKNLFASNIIFGNYGKTVEYYQNRVDKLRTTPGSNIGEWEVSLRGLILARINMARSKMEDSQARKEKLQSVFYGLSKPQALLDNITELLDQPHSDLRYNEYMTRNTMYYYWMQLAKVVGCSVEVALIRAKQWLEMEETFHFSHNINLNPEPYYYLRSLYYLEAREGSRQALTEARNLDRKIDRLASDFRFDLHRGNIRLIRDILVDGKGMAQLFDVSFCRTEEEMFRAMAYAKVRPLELQGHLDTFLNRSNASITVYSPDCWNNMEVRLEIGHGVQNSLTERQQGHNVMFYAGFSINHVCAMANTLKDLTSKEIFDAPQKLRDLSYNLNLKPVNGKEETTLSLNKLKESVGKSFEVDSSQSVIARTSKNVQRSMPETVEQYVKTNIVVTPDVDVYPTLNQQIVMFAPDEPTSSKIAIGSFTYNGHVYKLQIVSPTKVDREKILRAFTAKTQLSAKIVSQPSRGVYTAKLIKK